jgi:hypothetical protein
MKNIKAIGLRSSILIKNNVFSLVILPTVHKQKTLLLILWFFAWTTGGIIVMLNYPSLTEERAKLFVIIWLGFWAYFEYKIFRVCLWKQFGKEKLWIKNGIVFYQQSVNGKGKINEYDLNLITNIELIEVDEKNFGDFFSKSFWVKGGERICFTCQTKLVKLGMQLSHEESIEIIAEIKKYLKNRQTN